MIDRNRPELKLLIACCRFPPSPEAVSAAAAEVADWPAFESLIERHRVAGLVTNSLAQADHTIPAALLEKLGARARRAAGIDLQMAAETVRIQEIFDRAKIPGMFLKGAALGVRAYGRLGIKQSWDIDLLTAPDSMLPALRLLEANGYTLVEPLGLNEAELKRFAGFTHEAVLSSRGFAVELHWRLSKPHVLASLDPFTQAQGVPIGGREVRTLRDGPLFAYLCSHGQDHGWSRLKWLADVHAFLASRSGSIEALHAEAEVLGVGRCSLSALLLCETLFGLELPPALARQGREDRAVKQLVEVSLDCIAHPICQVDLPLLSRTNLALTASRFRRESGWRGRFAELGALWSQPRLRALYPPALDFAYHLLRIPVWLAKAPLMLLPKRQN